MTNTTIAQKETFWNLLGEYQIRIPMMQRDYAQGRLDHRATNVRNKFVNDIVTTLRQHLTDKTAQMNVNFIYGNVFVRDQSFVPIDGQQRLTTLFLLHWYLLMAGSVPDSSDLISDEEYRVRLKKFCYESRFTSRDFCEALIDNFSTGSVDHQITGKELIRKIEDYYWFIGDYSNDPTIAAMLVMIGAIHDKVNEVKCTPEELGEMRKELCSEQAEQSPIAFLFLDLNNAGMTDRIYLKMNARGRELTSFENFKAMLKRYLNQPENKNKLPANFSDIFIDQINNGWTKLFWKWIPKENITDKAAQMDSCMMRFFRFMILNRLISNIQKNAQYDVNIKNRMILRKLHQNLEEEQDYIFVGRIENGFSKLAYENIEEINFSSRLVDAEVFLDIYKILNAMTKVQHYTDLYDTSAYGGKKYMCQDENNENISSILMGIISPQEKKSITTEDRVLVYAELQFILRFMVFDDKNLQNPSNCSFVKQKDLTDWIRYIYNLVSGTTLNGAEDYWHCIKSIDAMLDGLKATSGDVNSYIANNQIAVQEASGFETNQAREESLKAELMLGTSGNTWKPLIENAENIGLDGQIQTLLSFSKKNGVCDPKEFEKYSERLGRLLGMQFDQHLPANFYRAMISVDAVNKRTGDDMFFVRDANAFSDFGDELGAIREPHSLKRYLRDDNALHRETLKLLLEQMPDKPATSVEEQLEDMIQQNLAAINSNKIDVEDWKKVLIKEKRILQNSSADGTDTEKIFKYKYKYIKEIEC